MRACSRVERSRLREREEHIRGREVGSGQVRDGFVILFYILTTPHHATSRPVSYTSLPGFENFLIILR